MAGVPKEVTIAAKEILRKLEKKIGNFNKNKQSQTLINFKETEQSYLFKSIVERVRDININQITPLEALIFLREIQAKIKEKN